MFSYDIYLCHSAKDKDVVRDIANRLKSDGVEVWFDEWEIKPGESIPAKIEAGLEHSRVLVLCMSANAFGSDWAQLESHTFRFKDPLNHDRRFIPLRLDDAPIKGSLAQFLHINWRPNDYEQEYPKLLEACLPPLLNQEETASDEVSNADFRSRFLQQCFEYLCDEQGLSTAFKTDCGMRERMNLHYLPTLPNGVPAFNVDRCEWDFFVGENEPANLHIDICSDGAFTLSPADDDGIFLEFDLDGPEELNDILVLIERLDEASSVSNMVVKRPLKDLVKSLQVIVPSGTSQALVSVDDLISTAPDAIRIMNAFVPNLAIGWDYLVANGFPGWREWCTENLNLPSHKLHPVSGQVCVISESSRLTTYRRWLAFDEIHRGISPPIALVLSDDACSLMFFSEFANQSPEGQRMLEELHANYLCFNEYAGSAHVDFPSTLLLQRRRAVELRSQRTK